MFRIGVTKEGPQSSPLGKPRPLKLIFRHEWEKQEVVSRFIQCKKAKSAIVSELSISNDRTRWEQEEFNRLKLELAERRESGEQDLMIRDLKIVSRFRQQQSQ